MNKILIANRGEIAVRIIRACKQLRLKTVAVYSEADASSLHVQIADEAVCIGGPYSSDSYLRADKILETAISTGADAIHPGFGFLSENSSFANLCKKNNISFIGPSGDIIDMMGDKATARVKMIEAGVPVVPGSEGTIQNVEDGLKMAEEIKYPVLIKASAGGGGRGMRIANTKEEFENAFNTAKSEAKAAFGDDTMYLEKLVLNPKHIEFQILADKYGNVVHLGERDCSVQRRNQKVIEEAPAKSLSDDLRKRMGEAAVQAAKYVNYENAGTIEFLVSGEDFYFIEMNTRIQVEHPVTEMVTGIDLIKEQISVASGKELKYKQEDIKFEGHSIECRINAENPQLGFRPSPGEIKLLHIPGGNGVRFDSAIYQGYSIPPFYDSMIGKLIVHDKSRKKAIAKLKSVLEELILEGIDTNVGFVYMMLHNPTFIRGSFSTAFVEENLDKLLDYGDKYE